MAGKEWPEFGHSSAKAEGQAHSGNNVAGKRATIQDQVRCRACLCKAEGQDEALHQDDRDWKGQGEDRHGNIAYSMLRYVFHEGKRVAALPWPP